MLMIRWFLTISCFVFLFFHPFSLSASSMEWGKIPQSDLVMTTYPLDSTANAVILGDVSNVAVYSTSSRFEFSRSHHRRIKVLDRKAFDWADVVIPIRDLDETEQLLSIKAQIFTPSGEKIVLSKKDFFKEKVTDAWSLLKFTFPNVEEGSIMEYYVRITSTNVAQLDTWYFHNEIPTRLSELKISVEAAFTYVTLFQGAERMEQKELKDGTTLLTQGPTKMRLKGGHYIMENAPAINEEAFITTIDDYRARIRFQLQELVYPDGFKRSFLKTWEELSENLIIDPAFGDQYRKKKHFKKVIEVIDPLIVGLTDETEKVKAIYQFVAKNIQWNGKYGIYPKATLNEVFQKKQGSGVELNMMVLALLNFYDLVAHPLLSATRSYGKMLQDYPIVEQFNHLMVLVEMENGGIIIDIPSRTRPLGLPQVNSLNSFAWKVDRDHPQWIAIRAPVGTDSFRSLIDFTEEGKVRCQMNMRFTNYNAISERANYIEDKDGTYWKDRLAEKMPEVTFERFDVKYLDDVEKPFINNLIFQADAAAQQIGDFIYLSPVLYSNFTENPFKQETRYYPVDFPYPFEERYATTIKVPEGYEVEELPEPVNFELERDAGAFSYTVEQKGNIITLMSVLKISELKVLPEAYPAIKKMLDLFIEKQGEQIVLKKVS